jgi:hypothetical protein
MTLTLDEVIDRICPAACAACGAELPRPGEECGACGELPGLLRAEAAGQLAAPGALAAKQAELCRLEAEKLRDDWIGKLVQADGLVRLGQLQQAAAAAENELTAATARRDQTEAAVTGPAAAEIRAAGDLAAADTARRDFDLKLRKAQRHKRDVATIVEARRALELAGEEHTARQAALQAATSAREQAEAALAAADLDAGRALRLRDSAAWRLEHPAGTGLSMESMNALAVPVLAIAKTVAPLRLGRPADQFTPADVDGDDRVAFAVAVAAQLGMLTGVMSAERAAGIGAGRKQAEAEQAQRPKVMADAVFPPGVLPR